jgi:hypothetical protein
MKMLRKIKRNYNRWFEKHFHKSNNTFEWQPPDPTQLPMATNHLNHNEVVLNTQFSQGNASYVKPPGLDIAPWLGPLSARVSHTGHDTHIFAAGTPMKFLPEAHRIIVSQHPDTNSIAGLIGGAVTNGDDDELVACERELAYWERYTEGAGEGAVSLYHPPAHRITVHRLGNLMSTSGNGCDQAKALLKLQTDPRTVPDLRKLVGAAIRSYKDYDPNGASLISIAGGGGTYPIHRFGRELLEANLKINQHIQLFLLPSAAEPLHIANMRGTVAHVIKHKDDEKNKSTLHIFYPLGKAGKHTTDTAMASGLITVTGNCQDKDRGEADSATKFSLIHKIAGNFLTAHPRIVAIPLKTIGRVVASNGRLHEELINIIPPDELGGKHVGGCLDELYNLVSEDFSAPHFISIAFAFSEAEIKYLTDGVKRFPLQEGGSVHLMFNVLWPKVNPQTNTAECLIVDFRGGHGVRNYLKAFLAEKHRLGYPASNAWDELTAIAERVAERSMTEGIEQDLLRILAESRL